MSYFVLARKWRPQTFEEVLGQGHVTKTLQNALKSGRLAHALIFSGPRGVGKTSVARILAKALNCEKGPSDKPCNQCDICREITSGLAVDVQEIDGASNRGIDEIRQLRENIKFMPSMCRYKTYIIDEVHMLTKEAFNALLKTLEEPPSHVYFIFATTEPQRIPPTIHSRCQHYGFRRLSSTELSSHLKKIAKEEGFQLDKDAISLIAKEAEGSVRDSLSLLDQMTAFGAITEKDVCEAMGIAGSRIIKSITESILSGDANSVIALLDEVYRSGSDIQKFVHDLLTHMRDLVILRECGTKDAGSLINSDMEEMEEMEALSKKYHADTLFQVLDALIKGQELIRKSGTPRISLEILLLRLCHMRDVVGIDALINKVGKMMEKGVGVVREREKSKVSPTPAPAPAPSTEADRSPEEITPQKWNAFKKFVKSKDPALSAMFGCIEASSLGEDSDNLKVALRQGLECDLLLESENRERFDRYVQEFFGVKAELIRKVSQKKKENNAHSSCEKDEELVNSPLVQEAIRVFQAKITDVKHLATSKKENNK
jgi:DNA polymerase-3 subunit gamma/tau